VPSREVEIVNKLGLHLRAAATLVQLSETFPSRISLIREGQRANGKSILSVLSLGAAVGSKVTIETNGEKADEALEAIGKFIADRFGESGSGRSHGRKGPKLPLRSRSPSLRPGKRAFKGEGCAGGKVRREEGGEGPCDVRDSKDRAMNVSSGREIHVFPGAVQ
jgi:phosphocarrier protein HPr